jgi:hypothetical protein
MNPKLKATATEESVDSVPLATQSSSITTRVTFATSTDNVWDGLLF